MGRGAGERPAQSFGGVYVAPVGADCVNTPPGVEDPISAIFDLSDRVAQMAPVVRRMYRYTATILVFWIIIMAIVALW